MPRAYSVRLVSLTLSTPLKWLDNLLSHHDLPGVVGGRQGVERQISGEGLLAIEMSRLLTSDLGVPVSRAVALVNFALANRVANRLTCELDSGVTLAFDAERIERRLRQRMTEAVESLGHVKRGRPRLPRT